MLRFITSLALALMLALTSQSMAVARGASAATGHMVLCTGTGPVAVYFDAQGAPTSAPHICPDAAMQVPFDTAQPDALVAWTLIAPELAPLQPAYPAPILPRRAALSRGPPLTL